MTSPLLGDLNSQLQVNPGDRILARVSIDLTRDQYRNLYRQVRRFLGEDVRLLVVNCLTTTILRQRFKTERLAGLEDIKIGGSPRIVLDCSVIDLVSTDILMVICQSSVLDKKADQIREWAGKEIAVRGV